MEAVSAGEPRRFDHLREHSIGLPQVLFQSITHMAPCGRGRVLDLHLRAGSRGRRCRCRSVLALIACICAATAIGQLAKLDPVGGRPLHLRRALARPWRRLLRRVALHRLFEPLVAPVPLPRVRLGDARR